ALGRGQHGEQVDQEGDCLLVQLPGVQGQDALQADLGVGVLQQFARRRLPGRAGLALLGQRERGRRGLDRRRRAEPGRRPHARRQDARHQEHAQGGLDFAQQHGGQPPFRERQDARRGGARGGRARRQGRQGQPRRGLDQTGGGGGGGRPREQDGQQAAG